MATFMIVHGAWAGGWAWQRLKPALAPFGHDFRSPTLTGLGDRFHLANPDIDVDVHIRDIMAVLEFEDLNDVVLIGHSYGGMVATGVADRAPERIARLIYLDAFVPGNGESLAGYYPPAMQAKMLEIARADGEGWRLPPGPLAPDIDPADAAWISARRRPQPIKTFAQKLVLTGRSETLPRTYVYCRRKPPDDVFRPFAERFRDDPDWGYFEIDAGHTPNLTAPAALAAILDRIVTGGR